MANKYLKNMQFGPYDILSEQDILDALETLETICIRNRDRRVEITIKVMELKNG